MPSITLRGPGDIVAALPYQLGYHLEDSVVVVAMHGQVVGMIERLDLPPAGAAERAARELVRPLRRERPEAVVIVAYEVLGGTAMPVLDALRGRLEGAGIPLLSRLVVREGRWFAPDCGKACCPAEGTPIPLAADIPAVAELVGLEIAPLPTRTSVAATVAPDPALTSAVAGALQAAKVSADTQVTTTWRDGGVRRIGPGQALSRASPDDHDVVLRWLTNLGAWAVVCDVRESAPAVTDLDPEVVVRLVASLRDVLLRDGLVAWLCPGTLPLRLLPDDLVDGLRTVLPTPVWRGSDGANGGPEAAIRDGSASVAGRRLVARLQALCRAVPDTHAAGVLTVLANLAWWLGDGAVARVALDRALLHAPEYRLALLTEQMVDVGLRPRGRSHLTDEPP